MENSFIKVSQKGYAIITSGEREFTLPEKGRRMYNRRVV